MLMFNSAPPAACSASGPVADHIQLVRITGIARLEVASLIEHRVVGQQSLSIGADDFASDAYRSGVVQIAIKSDVADDRHTTTCARRDTAKGRQVVGDEPRLEHQILRWIPGDRKLGKGDDVAASRLGLVVRGTDLGNVAIEVADRGVDLGQCDAQPYHAIRLPST